MKKFYTRKWGQNVTVSFDETTHKLIKIKIRMPHKCTGKAIVVPVQLQTGGFTDIVLPRFCGITRATVYFDK